MEALDILIQVIPLVLVACMVVYLGRAVASGKGFSAIREAVPAVVVMVVALAVIAGVSSIDSDDDDVLTGENTPSGSPGLDSPLFAMAEHLSGTVVATVADGSTQAVINGTAYTGSNHTFFDLHIIQTEGDDPTLAVRVITGGVLVYQSGETFLSDATVTMTAEGFSFSGTDPDTDAAVSDSYEGAYLIGDAVGFLPGMARADAIGTYLESPSTAGPGQSISIDGGGFIIATVTTEGVVIEPYSELDFELKGSDGTYEIVFIGDNTVLFTVEIEDGLATVESTVAAWDNYLSIYGPLGWRSSGAVPTPPIVNMGDPKKLTFPEGWEPTPLQERILSHKAFYDTDGVTRLSLSDLAGHTFTETDGKLVKQPEKVPIVFPDIPGKETDG